MSEDGVIKAVCPECQAEVEAKPDEDILDQPTFCPACKRIVQFEKSLSDEEVLLRGAAAAAKGAGKVGLFAGELLKKAASKGLAKYQGHRKHRKAIKQLEAGIQAHFRTERPSVEVLAGFRDECGQLGIELQMVAGELEEDFAAFLAREIDRIKTSGIGDAAAVDAACQYMEAFKTPEDQQRKLAGALGVLAKVLEIRSGRAKPLTDSTGLVVSGGEVVWHEAEAGRVAKGESAESVTHAGRLYVTSLRVVFTSRTAPAEIDLGDVTAVEVEPGRLFLLGKTPEKSLEFVPPIPEIAAEHVRQAIRDCDRD